MKKISVALVVFCMFVFGIVIQAQNAIPASGGSATGNGSSSVSYTVGQILCNTVTGTNGTSAQGVQQPYEISVITAIENTMDINLECTVYPNPTKGLVKLIVESFDKKNIRFRIYDINGLLLQDKKVESRETEISLENLSSSVYFLKIINDNLEVKVFKIVKR